MSRHSGRRLLALAALVALGAFLTRRLFPVRVEGKSMSPTLEPGDFILVSRRRPTRGRIAVVRGNPDVIKRVARVDGDRLFMLGDNPGASTDSRTTGPVHEQNVAGVALAIYWPPRRWRVLL